MAALVKLRRSAAHLGERPQWAARVTNADERTLLCKAPFLRTADLGVRRSMWVSVCQGSNGRFCLSGQEPFAGAANGSSPRFATYATQIMNG